MYMNESILVKELKRQLKESDVKEDKLKNRNIYLYSLIRKLTKENNVLKAALRS